jgi:hypothetical protein
VLSTKGVAPLELGTLSEQQPGLPPPAKVLRRFAAEAHGVPGRGAWTFTPGRINYAAIAALANATMASKAAGSAMASSDRLLRSSWMLAFKQPLMNSL